MRYTWNALAPLWLADTSTNFAVSGSSSGFGVSGAVTVCSVTGCLRLALRPPPSMLAPLCVRLSAVNRHRVDSATLLDFAV